MSEINEKLNHYISQLTELTRQGKIAWYRANPTVFAWDSTSSSSGPKKITLQEARSRAVINGRIALKKTYLFQLQNTIDRTANLTVDSKERPEFQDLFETLYQSITSAVDVRAASILEELLEDLDN